MPSKFSIQLTLITKHCILRIETIRQNALDAVSALLNLKTSSHKLVFASELQDIIARLRVVSSKNANLATAVDKLLLPLK